MGETSTEQAAEVAAGRSHARGKRILLVDDQRAVRDAIYLLLSLDDHTVVQASNGAEALDLFAREEFDLVITDFEMPLMRGDELAARIKQASRAQPVLMITAYIDRFAEAESPIDAVLNKPFQLEDLRRIITRLLPG